MAPISVLFAGTSAFALPSLRRLAADPRFAVTAVITQPDRPAGRTKILRAPPVKTAALALNLPILQPERIANAALPATDYLVVVSYGQILPQQVLDLPRIAPINVHASLLPALRGASPIQHAILQGLAVTGVTVQRMVQRLDAGPVLGRVVVPIEPGDTTPLLHDRLAEAGGDVLLKTLMQPLHETPQNESEATMCRPLRREDGIADPSQQSAGTIERMIRALTPWPGVTIRGTKILAASLIPHPDALAVPCAEQTTLYVTRLQPPSGTVMSGTAFSHGRSL